MNIEILTLSETLVPYVKGLISGYLNSSSNGVDESDSSLEQLENGEQILNRFIRNNLAQLYLAKHNQEYVGFIVVSWSFSITKGYPVLRIDAIYVSPLHRNKGVGGKLMQHAIELAIENKATRLQLETDEDNMPANTLYKNLGFKLIPGKGVYMSFL
jgi:ribosomal protein S18 acetylase RimI-like enzyme